MVMDAMDSFSDIGGDLMEVYQYMTQNALHVSPRSANRMHRRAKVKH